MEPEDFYDCAEQSSLPVNETLDDSGLGWGSFAVGALIGSQLSHSTAIKSEKWSDVLPSATDGEKTFIKQLLRFNQELDTALSENNHERILLLMNGFNGCLYGPWKKYLPGDNEYEPSPMFDLYFDDLILPVIHKAGELCKGNLTKNIPSDRLKEIERTRWELDEDTWEFKPR